MNTEEKIKVLSDTNEFLRQNPEAFSFDIVEIPYTDWGVACYLGWCGFFAGLKSPDVSLGDIARILFATHTQSTIYNQVGNLSCPDGFIKVAERRIEELEADTHERIEYLEAQDHE